jgi:hypothetical protein
MPIPPNIPWDQVLRHGPRVLDAATALFEKWQARRPEPVNPHDEAPSNPLQVVERRLQTLESAEAEQSALVREMAREMQGMAAELQRQRQRNRIALALAGAGLALSVIALFSARLA